MSIAVIVAGAVVAGLMAFAAACYVASDKVPSIKMKGARVVITGGSEGLGLCLSQLLVRGGSHLVVISRNQGKLDKALEVLKKESKDAAQKIEVISADVSNAESIKTAITRASDLLGGGIDVLINNAGITHPERFDTLKTEWIQKCMNVNFFGNVNAIQAVLPIMKRQKRGRIISVSSVLGLFGTMGYSAYAPSKAAIISLYETLQQEYYAYGIAFSVATPASIGTESFYEEEQKIKPAETLQLEKDDPVLPPEVVAQPIIASLASWRFLISPSGFNSYVMTTACAGWGPASFFETLSQVSLAGLFRLLGLFAFNSKARAISIDVRSKDK